MTVVPFATQSYQARSGEFSAQRCVNYYPESAPPDAKTPVVLYNSPGIKDFTNGLAGQIRGGLLMDGVLYVVARQHVLFHQCYWRGNINRSDQYQCRAHLNGVKPGKP